MFRVRHRLASRNSTLPTPPRRRRGAPRGNLNALVGGATSARLAPLMRLLPTAQRKIAAAAFTRSVQDALRFAPKGRSRAAVLARQQARLYGLLRVARCLRDGSARTPEDLLRTLMPIWRGTDAVPPHLTAHPERRPQGGISKDAGPPHLAARPEHLPDGQDVEGSPASTQGAPAPEDICC